MRTEVAACKCRDFFSLQERYQLFIYNLTKILFLEIVEQVERSFFCFLAEIAQQQ